MPSTVTATGAVLAAAEVRSILGALEAVVPPPRQLGGWESFCATEYAGAVLRLEWALADARGALAEAIRLLGA